MNKKQSIACDLTAIPADARPHHLVVAQGLFATVGQVEELSDGYAFQFANEPGRLMVLANYITYEQLCCPFLHFAMEIEPYGGPVRLRLTGGTGVKEALASVLPWLSFRSRVSHLSPGRGHKGPDQFGASAAL